DASFQAILLKRVPTILQARRKDHLGAHRPICVASRSARPARSSPCVAVAGLRGACQKQGRDPALPTQGRAHADMSTSTPAISVLMPVYNAGRFLAPALDSILAQTFSDFELIAIDGGSTDGSATVLAEFAARDARMIVVEDRNSGLVASLN